MPQTTSLADLENQLKAPAETALEKADPEKIRLDVEETFLLYATLCGDQEATAAALGVPARYIALLALTHGWDTKLAPIIARKKSKRPGDVERAINRALNFTMAHRYRTFLERVLRIMMGWSDAEVRANLVQESRGGEGAGGHGLTKIQSRALADFVVALQKCGEMTYSALCDSSPERTKRKETVSGDDELSVSSLHAQLAKGMQDEPTSGAAELAAAQMTQAQAQAVNAVKVEYPPVEPLTSPRK